MLLVLHQAEKLSLSMSNGNSPVDLIRGRAVWIARAATTAAVLDFIFCPNEALFCIAIDANCGIARH